jgi:hypothetical protein
MGGEPGLEDVDPHPALGHLLPVTREKALEDSFSRRAVPQAPSLDWKFSDERSPTMLR